MVDVSKWGIYLNTKTSQVLRINSPYYIPEGPEWVYLTPEVNATLLAIRQMAREKRLVPDPDKIDWGDLPKRPGD